MGWQNPPLPWAELERRLAGRPPPAGRPPGADGGDAPAWSSRRQPYRSPGERGPAGPGSGGRGSGGLVVPYAELHCHSNASFLDGGSHPEELAEEAARLRLEALAITDHDGMYGIVRFAEVARALGLPTIFGAELTLPGAAPAWGRPRPGAAAGADRTGGPQRAGRTGEPQRTGTPDPAGEHLVVLARGAEGYGRLCRAISEAQLAGAKGAP
ncbi:MAG TPA: PHP domain-containing protein, partial [Actinomycetota bacterium]|nr:PHP domain-containing protein [Actinomycetota bacterium]